MSAKDLEKFCGNTPEKPEEKYFNPDDLKR